MLARTLTFVGDLLGKILNPSSPQQLSALAASHRQRMLRGRILPPSQGPESVQRVKTKPGPKARRRPRARVSAQAQGPRAWAQGPPSQQVRGASHYGLPESGKTPQFAPRSTENKIQTSHFHRNKISENLNISQKTFNKLTVSRKNAQWPSTDHFREMKRYL